MSFEQFDQQINDAAEKHHPVYHDEAWAKMQRLLDKHLPVKEKRKKRAILLLPLLLLLSAGGYMALKNTGGNTRHAANEKQYNVKQAVHTSSANGPAVLTDTKTGDDFAQQNAPGPGTATGQPAEGSAQNNLTSTSPSYSGNSSSGALSSSKINDEQYPTRTTRNPGKRSAKNLLTRKTNTGIAKRSLPSVIANDDDDDNTVDDDMMPAPEPAKQETNIADEARQEAIKKTATSPVALAATDDNEKKEPAKKETAPSKKRLQKNGFSNSFALLLNAGVDMSAVHFTNPGKKRVITGIGLQYAATRNLVFRTGIYQTNKVYGAYPADYHPGANYTPSGYMLTYLHGDCRVFEIPVSVAFSISPGKSWSVFASLGATSTIMKREDYTYYYKTPYGNSNWGYVLSNKNEHLFSSMDFSVGVDKKISNKLFFRAEPYFRLPLHGVGYGNIRLKSTGIMLGAGFRPFAKK